MNMKSGDKVVLKEKSPKNSIDILKKENLKLGYEYTISSVIGDRIQLGGFGDRLFFKSRFKPREEYETPYMAFHDYNLFYGLMRSYINSIPAGVLREEAARGIKGFWDFVDINYQRNLPEGSDLRTRSDKELGIVD